MSEDGETYDIDDSALATEDADPDAPEHTGEPGGGITADTGDESPRPRKPVAREFVIQVVLLNLGLLAVALGLMLLYFRWWLDMGSGLIVVGLVTLLAAYRRYRQKPPNTR